MMADYPLLIPSSFLTTDCRHWTMESLAKELKNKSLTCRVWKKKDAQVLETECDLVKVTLLQFYEWLDCNPSAKEEANALHCYDRKTHAAYIDYKYMKNVFSENPQLMCDVDWAKFGLPDCSFTGKDSTIWIGSEGSNTPGHQDCYGFNLVTQIQGRKLWLLFPPWDTHCLYPTRIPYEESSIFSQAHLGNPDLTQFPKLKNSHPIVVVLHPGETLYVPHHWWHYVESLDPSISINVWVPHEDDSNSHLTEAVSRYLATSLMNSISTKDELDLLNPTETLYSCSENSELIKSAMEGLLLESPIQQMCIKTSGIESDIDKFSNKTVKYLDMFIDWLKSSCVVSSDGKHCLRICGRCGRQSDCCTSLNVENNDYCKKPDTVTKQGDSQQLKKSLEGNVNVLKRKNQETESDFSPKKIHLEIDNQDKHISTNVEHLDNNISNSLNTRSSTETSCSQTLKSTNIFLFSSPLPFDEYLSLMKNKTAYMKSKTNFLNSKTVNDKSESGARTQDHNDFTFVSHDSIESPSSLQSSISKDSEQCISCCRPLQQTSMLNKTCSIASHNPNTSINLISSTVPLLKSVEIQSPSQSLPACATIQSEKSHFIDTDISTTSPALTSLSHMEEETFNEINNIEEENRDDSVSQDQFMTFGEDSNPKPSPALTNENIHKLLFDCVLHPSVVQQISSLFKKEYQKLLGLKN